MCTVVLGHSFLKQPTSRMFFWGHASWKRNPQRSPKSRKHISNTETHSKKMENNWPCSKNRQELRVVSHKLFPLNLLLGTDYPCWVFFPGNPRPNLKLGSLSSCNLFHPFLGAPTSCQWIGGLVSRKICRKLCGFRDPRPRRSLSLPRLNQGLPPWRRWRRTLWRRASGTRTFRWWEVWFCFASWNRRVRCFFCRCLKWFEEFS